MKLTQQKSPCFSIGVLALTSVLAGSSAWPVEQGSASWYSVNTNGGTHTASGQTLRDGAATAAHKTLPLGTKARVTNLANGKSEIVTITDRGPYIPGRIIDVTIGIAERLGFVTRGVAPVKVEALGHSAGTEERSSPSSADSDDQDGGQTRSRKMASNSGRRFGNGERSARRNSSVAPFGGPRRGF